jgi:hypothetical protein
MKAAFDPPSRKEPTMSKYLLAVHASDEDLNRPMTAEEMRQGFEQVDAVEREMRAADALLFSGRLLPADLANVVRPTRRRIKTTDGPYPETKEHIGGFYIVEAPDRDAALGWAEKVSLAIQTPIEVRPFADEPPRAT